MCLKKFNIFYKPASYKKPTLIYALVDEIVARVCIDIIISQYLELSKIETIEYRLSCKLLHFTNARNSSFNMSVLQLISILFRVYKRLTNCTYDKATKRKIKKAIKLVLKKGRKWGIY